MSQVFDADSDANEEYLYHVVCHDCEFERVEPDSTEAATVKSHHAVAEDHSVEWAEVA